MQRLDQSGSRFVIEVPGWGVFLGVAEGETLIFSQLDPMGLSSAPTFGSEAEVAAFVALLPGPFPSIKLHRVAADIMDDDGGPCASIDAIGAAGLERWDPDELGPLALAQLN